MAINERQKENQTEYQKAILKLKYELDMVSDQLTLSEGRFIESVMKFFLVRGFISQSQKNVLKEILERGKKRTAKAKAEKYLTMASFEMKNIMN